MSNPTINEIIREIHDEDTAMGVYLALMTKFGWKGTVITPVDIEVSVLNRDWDADYVSITERICQSNDWVHDIEERMIEDSSIALNRIIDKFMGTRNFCAVCDEVITIDQPPHAHTAPDGVNDCHAECCPECKEDN